MVYPITKFWLYPFCRILLRKIKGKENIPNKTPFIIISNHNSRIDPHFILYTVLRKLNKKVHFIATPAYWFLSDKICRQWVGCIPLFNPKQAYREAKELIESGEIVGIFPEGRLYKKIRTPKLGVARLALETNTPILSIGIKSSYMPFNAAINIGKLIYLKKNKKKLRKEMESVMKYVYELKNSVS